MSTTADAGEQIDADPETPNYSPTPGQTAPVDIDQPNYSSNAPGSQGPLYVGPNEDGTHQVQTSDGNIFSVPFESLPPSLQDDAVQTAAANPQPASPWWAASPNQRAYELAKSTPTAQRTSEQQAAARGEFSSPAVPGQADTAYDAAKARIAAGQPLVTADAGATAAPTAPLAAAPAPAIIDSLANPTAARTGTGAGGGANMSGASNDELTGETTAAKEQQAIDTATGAAKLSNAKQAGLDLEDQQEQNAIYEQARQKQMADIQGKAIDAANKFATAQIDPRTLYSKMTAGNKALTWASFILGGIGQGLTKSGSNAAVDEYDKDQNRDLEIQKFNIQHNKEAGAAFTGVLSDLRASGLDHKTAMDTALNLTKEKMVNADSQAVLASSGQQAQQAFDAQVAPLKMKIQQNLANIQKTHAETFQANAGAQHTVAETGQLGLGNAQTQALRDAQENLANNVPFKALPGHQRRALIQNAQASKMLIPRLGIAQREVTPEDQEKIQALAQARKTKAEIDAATQDTALNLNKRIAAAGKAAILKAHMSKALGGKLSPKMEALFDEQIPAKPGDIDTLWKAHSEDIGSTLNDIQSGLYNGPGGLGLTPFNNIDFTPTK